MTTLSQRLAALHTERGAAVASYERTLEASLAENRDVNDTEQVALDELTSRIKSVDTQIERLADAERMIARNAQPVTLEAVPGDRPGTFVTLATQRDRPQVQMRRRDEYKGADFTRMAIAICRAGAWNAAEYARQRWGDDELAEVIRMTLWVQRAPSPPMATTPGATVPATTGSALIRSEHLGSEFIEMLRPQLIVTRMPGMRRLGFDGAGQLIIPRQNGGVAGGYVGEAQNIRVQNLVLGQLTLAPSKLAVIVPTTVELLDRSDPGIEQLIRDDMLAGTAQTIDNAFFSTGAAGAAPAGILNGIAQVPGAAIPANPTVVQVTDALRAMIQALRNANVPMTSPVWIMNARTKEYLRLQRSAATDVFVWKAEMDAGTLLSYPVIDSTSIPIPFPPGTGANTAYALIDASQLIWAEDRAPMIDASEHASIIASDNPSQGGTPPGGTATPPGTDTTPYYSAFQNDLVFMRIRMRHTWARRHNVAVAWALTAE